MLRFLGDECCEGQIVRALRLAGYDVSYVPEWSSGLSDALVRQTSMRERRILITQDLGIWPPRSENGQLFGLVLTRLERLTPNARAERVIHAVGSLGDKLIGHITVVSESNFRCRSLQNSATPRR